MERFEALPESERADRYARLARKALSTYGLDEARLTYLGESSHVTFEVTTGDPSRHYALRICGSDQDPNALQREILWLTTLRRDTDLAVPEPILTMDGRLVQKASVAGIPGFRPYVLFRWVDGESLDHELTSTHLRSVGRLIAALHGHAETFRWPEEITPPRRNATLMSEVLDEGLLRTHYTTEKIEIFRRAVRLIAETMSFLRDGRDVAGVIHADLDRRNVLFLHDDARAIGFESCRWGYYAYDLATVRGWIEGREEGSALVAALLEGYRSKQDVPADFDRQIDVFSALRTIDRVQSTLPKPGRTASTARRLDVQLEKLRAFVETH